ncbi:MAG TPA: 2Fe-2S iron-sulfur cluster-binding protein, partial [Pyrinomonadaceae bacterium]|nr:2Fe-2S iron-sulfur cluster-binding protein [Pyrinomonadaceae bacterium]
MEFFLNGVRKQFTGDPQMRLLQYLREVENVISPKDGCSPQGACGCCSVMIDDRALLSCTTPMSKVEGRSVVTTEGISAERRRIFTNAFVEKGAVQCGFCTPGFVIQANALLDKNPAPSREEIEKAVNANLCRCTGYKKIIDAIDYAAESLRENRDIPAPVSDGRVGRRHPRYLADRTVLGHRPYIDDLTRPNPDDPTGKSVMRRIEDVLDVWFDSGSMPFAQVHYPFENREWFDSHNPADFIVEYIGQTRGWFYVMHVL